LALLLQARQAEAPESLLHHLVEHEPW
jgi:hypothetical protein